MSRLVDELGFDVAVNYNDPDFRSASKAATPDPIDVYFDNTGRDILESVLFRMNTRGRVVCCGAVSQYDTANPIAGPRGVSGLLVNSECAWKDSWSSTIWNATTWPWEN